MLKKSKKLGKSTSVKAGALLLSFILGIHAYSFSTYHITSTPLLQKLLKDMQLYKLDSEGTIFTCW